MFFNVESCLKSGPRCWVTFNLSHHLGPFLCNCFCDEITPFMVYFVTRKAFERETLIMTNGMNLIRHPKKFFKNLQTRRLS
jgi:hypothetical protein